MLSVKLSCQVILQQNRLFCCRIWEFWEKYTTMGDMTTINRPKITPRARRVADSLNPDKKRQQDPCFRSQFHWDGSVRSQFHRDGGVQAEGITCDDAVAGQHMDTVARGGAQSISESSVGSVVGFEPADPFHLDHEDDIA